MTTPVLIFGAGTLGQAALEVFQQNDIVVYGFLDDDTSLHNTTVRDVPVLGSTDNTDYLALLHEECSAHVATATLAQRQRLIATLKAQYQTTPVNAIHPSAQLASAVTVGYGNLVDAGAILGVGTSVGHCSIIHTHATVAHQATIGDYVEIGPGSIIGAGATVNEQAFVGPGATIIGGVVIGAGASVGAGAVVLAPVPAGAAVLGNPAQPVKR
ncbi:MAG: NeuD/PglB/VioB family sugar acetyltransferase [Bacteroidota bacterium]